MKYRHLLVTGGCGFIGSNFIRFMLDSDKGIRITNIDKLTYAGNKNSLKDIEKNKRYKFSRGDISNEAHLKKLNWNAFDAVVHFAAESHVDASIENPLVFIKTNVDGTAALLEFARKFKTKKFVFISTDEVYGSIKKGFFSESSKMNPSSAYSASKASADILCQAFIVTYKMPIVIHRGCNNYGPYQFPEKVIPLFITNLMKNKKIPLYSKGENIRDWIYVLDNCKAIKLLLEKGKN